MLSTKLLIYCLLAFSGNAYARTVLQGPQYGPDEPDESAYDYVLEPEHDDSLAQADYRSPAQSVEIVEIGSMLKNATLDALGQLKSASSKACGKKLQNALADACYLHSVAQRYLTTQELAAILQPKPEEEDGAAQRSLREACCRVGCSGLAMLQSCGSTQK